MPTKAQLKEEIMQMFSDAKHARRKSEDRIRELETQTNQLLSDLAKAEGYLRPYFVPRDAGPLPLDQGTAHCPVCDASAPSTLLWVNGKARVVTARPIQHGAGCYFVEQKEKENGT